MSVSVNEYNTYGWQAMWRVLSCLRAVFEASARASAVAALTGAAITTTSISFSARARHITRFNVMVMS